MKIFYIFLFAFVFRLTIVYLGFHGDMNNQISWGTIAYQGGLNEFYEGKNLEKVKVVFENGYAIDKEHTDTWTYSAPNQPPLTILMLTAMAGLWFFVGNIFSNLNYAFSAFPSGLVWFWESKGMILVMKLPSIIADLGIGYILYRFIRKSENIKKYASTIAVIWLFNPIVWYNSAIWGQTDSVVNLLGLLSVLSLLGKKLRWAAFWFSLCILFKGSLIYFAPILFSVALIQKYSWKEWIISIFYSFVVLLLTSIWFHPYFDFPLWLFELYTNVFIPGEIGYLSANAFNFWWLVDSGATYDSIKYFGVPARVWGFTIPFFVMLWQIIILRKGITNEKVIHALAITSFSIFLFMTRIHERYLYPFFPYATLLLVYIPRLWLLYIVISAIHLINLYNLFWVPSLPFLERAMHEFYLPWFLAFSLLVSSFVFFSITRKKDIQ